MEYVTYTRVSTRKQDLGLDAQQTIINNHLKEGDTIVGAYIEKETGTNKKVRPELTKALEHCKGTGATLLIAKLDRLSRNVAFISNLMDSGVEFKALDLPMANRMTIQIFAVIAEHEAHLISSRTKAALNELKKKGVQLGKLENLTQEGRDKGIRTNMEKARNNPRNQQAKAHIALLRPQGLTLKQIADELNRNGFRTSRGKEFQAVQVHRLSI